MSHVSTKMKKKHEVAIYENKDARGRPKAKVTQSLQFDYIVLIYGNF